MPPTRSWVLWAESLRRFGTALAGRDVVDLVRICIVALGRYKLRTALSVVGVVFGVAAVIAMMSVSEGARREALRQFELLGLDNIVIRDAGLGTGEGLRFDDARKLAELVPLVSATTSLVETFQVVTGPQDTAVSRIIGVTHTYQRVLRIDLSAGRFLQALDVDRQARVCVLGRLTARHLFRHRSPINESVRIGSVWYQVVGVLEERSSDARLIGALAARDLNQLVIVPLPVLIGHSLELDPSVRIDELWIQLADGERIVEVGKVVDRTLQLLHRGSGSWELVLPRELLNQRLRTQQTFSVVVGAIAVISLIVGGIGIMNIMLASVLERTHEIGIRRAVGATQRDVMVQFLGEALLMTLSGGAAGILLGGVVSAGVTFYAGWATDISVRAVLLAFFFSAVVGILFGFYPASRAARLEPMDAVRYE